MGRILQKNRILEFMTFVGKDGSMGFRKGKEYALEIFIQDGYIWVGDGRTTCPYHSLSRLLENWAFKREVED